MFISKNGIALCEDVFTLGHRHILPVPEIASLLYLIEDAHNGDADLPVFLYFNKMSNRLAFTVECPHCESHHALFEFDMLERDSDLEDEDRFFLPSYSSQAFGDFRMSQDGPPPVSFPVYAGSHELIEHVTSLRGGEDKVGRQDLHDFFRMLSSTIDAFDQGKAALGLCLATGRTVIGWPCDDCEKVHGVMRVRTLGGFDMRQDSRYVLMGNAFNKTDTALRPILN